MSENKMSKREFLSHLVTLTGASVVAMNILSNSASAQEKRRGAKKEEAPKAATKEIDWPMVEAGKGTAAALAYHESHADADKDPKTDKKTDKGVAWDKRTCDNCSFYTKVGDKGGKEAGKCTLFQNSLVASKGICNSWAKKG
ncbi:MAG: high-potential iron-sulfur protein [Bdellovibrionaceae bacterium]|nr:high-potential iron-sulfur protein [Pseudobdellovibrionaceae bacterium]